MVKYIVKRVLLMIPMLILALIISWVLSQLMFVDPVLNKMGMLDIELLEAERIRIGFYDPWYVKLGLYLKNLLKFILVHKAWKGDGRISEGPKSFLQGCPSYKGLIFNPFQHIF